AADRDLGIGERLPLGLGIKPADLLAHDAAGRDRIDRDPFLADLPRKALRPGVNAGLSGEGGVEPVGLRLAGDVDDAAEATLDHLRQERMRALAHAREI